MLNTDKPITKSGEDFLNRKVFADNISTAIKNYENKNDSLTIGLYGKWGIGKTSIVNMIVEVLEIDDNIIIFKFEPWIYSDTQQLISHFFREFAKAVKHKDFAQDAMKIGEELEAYASFFEPMSLIPDPTTSLISLVSSKVLGSAGKASKRWGKLKTKSLSATKESIEKHLLKFDKKILIVIDDIDRLNNTEIRQIFQMVKILGNFSNTIYMAVMDREVVVDALSEVQKGDGSEYLEKIIHVPFEVPAILQSDVLDFLIKELKEIIKEDDIDETRWWEIYHDGFKYFFQNIRDVKRYINVLKFNFKAIGKEVNNIDLIAITAIQVFEAKTYEIIKNNKEVFLGSLPDFDENKKFVEELLNNLYSSCKKINKKNCQEFIEALFPYVGFHNGDIPDRRKDLKICSGDFFDVYFQMTLSQNEISNEKLKQYIDSASNEEDFRKTLLILYKDGKLDRFLVRFLVRFYDYAKDDVSKDKFQVIFNALMDLGETFSAETKGVFFNTNVSQILIIFKRLLHSVEEQKEKFNLLKTAIEKSENILMICYETHSQMKQHGEIDEERPIHEDNRSLSTEKLQDLKKVVKKKIENWVEENKLFEHEYGLTIWYLWVKLDKEEADKYKIEQLKDNNQLLKVLEKSTRHDYFSDDNIEEFNYDGFKKFIDVEIIVEQIKELDKDFENYDTTDKSRFVIDGFLKEYNDEKEE